MLEGFEEDEPLEVPGELKEEEAETIGEELLGRFMLEVFDEDESVELPTEIEEEE